MRPHRRQPTRLPHPWDSPGKNTGVGCHFLLQCMKVKSESEVTQLCPTLSDPMDCSLPGSSVHGIFQAGVLEWGAIAFSEFVPNPRLIPMARSMWPIHGQFWSKPSSVLSQLLWPRILNHVKRMVATIWVTCLELDGRRSSPKEGRRGSTDRAPGASLWTQSSPQIVFFYFSLCFSIY